MTPEYWVQTALNPALRLLPSKMDSPGGRAMSIAICLQESRLKHRRQIGGPARGYGQFEQGGGVHGVLTHPATKPYIQSVLGALDYNDILDDMKDGNQNYADNAAYIAIEHNDILMAAFVRLNLWWLPTALPTRDQTQQGWEQYLKAWRPGAPHSETWDAFYEQAWLLTASRP